MSEQTVTLFDLESKQGHFCWSPNVWKTRLVLNYKQLPYKTHWLNHNTVATTLQATGLPRNTQKPGQPPMSDHTVPAIGTPDGSFTMESMACAEKLESIYPTPSLHLDTGLHTRAAQIIGKVLFPLLPMLFPIIGRTMIVDSAYETWRAKREVTLGGPLDEVERTRGGDVAWKGAQPGLEELKVFLREHQKDAGPFVLGSQPSYADFLIVSPLETARVLDDTLFKKLVSSDSRIKEVYEACRPWLETND